MPSTGTHRSPADRRRMAAKGLRPGCGKFGAVLRRRMRKASAWREV